MKAGHKRFVNCIMVGFMSSVLLTSGVGEPVVYAENSIFSAAKGNGDLQQSILNGIKPQMIIKPLQLAQVKTMALANSAAYRKLKSKIALKKVKYNESVKKLKLKKKNMESFRWSPLLNFKLPEKLDLIDEYEFKYKPLEIQSEITSLKHELSDCVHSSYEEASLAFVKVYTLQESIAFDEERLDNMKDTLKKNQARLILGEASQSDIDKMEKSVGTLEKKLSSDKRSYETKKEDLSDLIKLDVSVGYEFKNPYLDTAVTRDYLMYFENYALENDHTYFQAKLASQMALIAMETNYSLMRNQYGGDMNGLDTYINQVKMGEIVDSDALKQCYDDVLDEVDSPWAGKFGIWFLSFPKEWIKGAISGVRYVEDEPYKLYSAILEYQEALVDEAKAKKTLIKQVDGDFENLITTKNAYFTLVEDVAASKASLTKSLLLNATGELPYEDLKVEQEDYESLQLDMLEALDLYTQTLCSYDRLVCGALSMFLYGTGTQTNAAVGGESYLVDEDYDGAYYYIKSLVEDNMFELGVYIPEDFSVAVSDYELWCDDLQIGERTEIEKKIRHLTLSTENVEKVFLRFYDGEKFVDDCVIDPSEYTGELTITGGYKLETKEEKSFGSYTSTTNETTGITSIKIIPEEPETIGFYVIKDKQGNKLYSSDFIPVSEKFNYLSLVANDLEELQIELYDPGKQLLSKAYFDTANLLVKAEPEPPEG